MTSLHKIRKDLAAVSGYGPTEPHSLRFPRCYPGPNNWDGMSDADFGPEHDYTVEVQGRLTVITPASKAALHFLYRHLPEDCPRWGKLGFCVETKYADDVMTRMGREGLLSLEEYDIAMAFEERDRGQGWDI